MKRKALGRGLSALIPEANRASRNDDYFVCPVEQIRPNASQPRRFFDEHALGELVASIREHGMVQPLVVRPASPRSGAVSYVLIAGERRWRAAQKAGLREVPVVIRDVNDTEAFEIALVENIQRQDLNPIEEAEAYQRLLGDHGYTQEQLAERVGKDRSTIANSLRLLKLPEAGQQALIAGAISGGHARALLGLEKPRLIQRAVKEIVQRGLSVRQTEALVKAVRNGKAEQPAPPRQPSANQRDLQDRLIRTLKTRVRVIHHDKNNSGRIEIHYGSLDELDRLLETLLR